MPEGATIIPILFGIDETNVNTQGRMSYYSLYLSIGNLPKKVWHTYSQYTYVLVEYFSSSDVTEIEGNRLAFTEVKKVLYYKYLRTILKDLNHTTQMYIYLKFVRS